MKAKKTVAKVKKTPTRRRTAAASATKPPAQRKIAARTAKAETVVETASARPTVAESKSLPRRNRTKRSADSLVREAGPKLEPPVDKPVRAPRKTARRKPPVELPPILLEGDFPPAPPVSGPGEKFALGPTPPAQEFPAEATQLPEAYGTKRLFLTARDPHWLYVNWDFTREQQAGFNRKSADGHLVARIYFAPPDGALAVEVHVHPESRHWFAHVGRAAAKYTGELGYYDKKRQWVSLARSGATLTPPETVSAEAEVEFATIPAEVSFDELLVLVQGAVQSHQPLARAIEDLRHEGHPALPAVVPPPSAAWTTAQAQALAEVVNLDQVRRVWIGSMEITEVLRRQMVAGISSVSAAQLGLPTSPGGAVASVSSPFGGEQLRAKGFWFNVNAELIIYGATERDATVTIGGRQIKLRHDGSFSYRFALPDGNYDLPVVAVSADGTDGRAAQLKFTRATEIRGDVGAHPQDPELKTPTPDNV